MDPINVLDSQGRCSFLSAGTMLRSYQGEGVQWLVRQYDHGVGGILGDEMGLGKTVQTLSFLAYLKARRGIGGPHLIVTPLAVLHNGANESKRFTPDFKVPCWRRFLSFSLSLFLSLSACLHALN